MWAPISSALGKGRASAWLLGALVAVLAIVATAHGAVSISAFTLIPSKTQAGSNPDLPLHAVLAPTGSDDAKDLTLSLAPGLLANPAAVSKCTQAQLAAAACPAASKVGDGTLHATATVVVLPVPIDAPVEAFMVEPNADEAGRIGLIARPPLVPALALAGSAKLRGTPDVGLDVTFVDLPRTAGGLSITLESLDLTLYGTVGSNVPFTRNPTACAEATSRLTVVPYDTAGPPATASSAFTPTGCEALDYSPTLTATAVADAATQSVELTASIAQDLGEAATKRIELALPADAAPRLSELGRACDNADAAACPETATIGTATADVPHLGQPLAGRLVMMKSSGALPDLAIVLPNPAPLQLRGKTALIGGALLAVFDGIPDVPLRRLDVKLTGGAKSLLQITGPSLCANKPPLKAKAAGHNGKEASLDGPLTVTGSCPTATPPATPAPRPVPATIASAQLTLSKLATKRPRLRLTINVPSAGLPLAGLELRLPSTLRLNRRARGGLTVTGNGARVRRSDAVVTASRVRAALRGGARTVVITISGPTLRVSGSLRSAVRRRRSRQITVTATLVNTFGATRKLRPRAAAR